MNKPAPTPPNVSLWNGDLPFLKLDTLALDAGGLLIQSLLAANFLPRYQSTGFAHSPRDSLCREFCR